MPRDRASLRPVVVHTSRYDYFDELAAAIASFNIKFQDQRRKEKDRAQVAIAVQGSLGPKAREKIKGKLDSGDAHQAYSALLKKCLDNEAAASKLLTRLEKLRINSMEEYDQNITEF